MDQFTAASYIEMDDVTYNRLMDEIVSDNQGDVASIIAEITRLGLHRSGVGRCPSLDDPKKKDPNTGRTS
jgi:hypothetical protein